MTPHQQLSSYLTGKWIPPVLGVIARLGIPDLVADRGPTSVEDLAAATDTDATALYRVLRAAASVGVLVEHEDGRFGLTDLADLLRSGVEGSLRYPAMMMSLEPFWSPYARIMHSVRTGRPAFEEMFGASVYDYLKAHPEDADVFGRTVGAFHAEGIRAVAEVLAGRGLRGTVVDVGGGNGALLADLLRRVPDLHGVLLDTAEVVASADPVLVAAGVDDRVEAVAGDFFVEVPAGDAFLVKSNVHNFADDDAVALLRTIAAAMHPSAPLFVVETVVPPGNEPHYSKLDDIEMLVIAGGADRTLEQYDVLLRRAGLMLTDVVPAGQRFTILQASLA